MGRPSDAFLARFRIQSMLGNDLDRAVREAAALWETTPPNRKDDSALALALYGFATARGGALTTGVRLCARACARARSRDALAESLALLAWVLMALPLLPEAEKVARRAVALADAQEIRAVTLTTLAIVQEMAGKTRSSWDLALEALATIRPGVSRYSLPVYISAVSNLAACLESGGSDYRLALQTLEGLRDQMRRWKIPLSGLHGLQIDWAEARIWVKAGCGALGIARLKAVLEGLLEGGHFGFAGPCAEDLARAYELHGQRGLARMTRRRVARA